MTALVNANFLVCDTESTGTGPEDTVVEIAYVLTSATEALSSGETLVDPGDIPVSNEARAVHHINPALLPGQPNLRGALKGFLPALASYEVSAYAAHFAEFDSRMIPMLRAKSWLCTYRLAKKLLPELPHHGNQYLRYQLGLDVPQAEGLPAHRAMADAWVTSTLLRRLLALVADRPELPQDVDGLCAFAADPFLIPTCTFPKHKDKSWAQVVKADRPYCQWLLSLNDGPKPLDADTTFTIKHWLEELS